MSNQELDFSLLDREIGDIEDLPGFEVPPNGEYLFKLKTEVKKINEKTAVTFGYEVLETLKLDKDDDTAPKEGTKFNTLFFLEADKKKSSEEAAEQLKISLGKLKELVAPVAETTGQGNLGILVRDILKECIVRGTVRRRQDKEDPEKFYGSVKNLTLQ